MDNTHFKLKRFLQGRSNGRAYEVFMDRFVAQVPTGRAITANAFPSGLGRTFVVIARIVLTWPRQIQPRW